MVNPGVKQMSNLKPASEVRRLSTESVSSVSPKAETRQPSEMCSADYLIQPRVGTRRPQNRFARPVQQPQFKRKVRRKPTRSTLIGVVRNDLQPCSSIHSESSSSTAAAAVLVSSLNHSCEQQNNHQYSTEKPSSASPRARTLKKLLWLPVLLVVLLSSLVGDAQAAKSTFPFVSDSENEIFYERPRHLDESPTNLTYYDLEFTQSEYHVVIPENSLGRVYAVPSDLTTKMGIPMSGSSGVLNRPDSLSVRFRIKSGDPDNFFKAEAEVVGDFVFLLIRFV